MLGACTLRGPLWVILEFCPHGDLLQFLRKRREVLPQWKKESECTDMLCLMDLLRMAIEITEGMRYIFFFLKLLKGESLNGHLGGFYFFRTFFMSMELPNLKVPNMESKANQYWRVLME